MIKSVVVIYRQTPSLLSPIPLLVYCSSCICISKIFKYRAICVFNHFIFKWYKYDLVSLILELHTKGVLRIK